jgi:ATP-binding cassette subfamily F protein 3
LAQYPAHMLTLSGIHKAYSGRVLLSDATLQLVAGDRIGLVGPNGAGKSTLFRMILGEEEPDQGGVVFQRGVTVGYLPQESAPVEDETVLEVAISASRELLELWRRLNRGGDGGEDHEAKQEFDALDGYRVVAKARQILSGLSFREEDHERAARTLSGGWVMRAHLAKLLVQAPDLLLLDEPTNHLDLEALLWFQEHLKGYRGGILVISHDREFLNQLVGSIVEIRQSKLFRYRGNYESFVEQRQATEEQLLAAYKNQQREIARLQDFADRFRAKNTKASQAQSKLKQIERMEKIEAPESEAPRLSFQFPQPQRSGQRVIRLGGVDFSYGEKVVYRGMNFEVERGQRVVLVGPNGAGKSTLLKLAAGVLEVQGGERVLGHNVKAGYFSQYRTDVLNEGSTVLEEALDTPQALSVESVRTVLGSFLFRGDDVFKPVRVLSGGEKSRLALVKLLLDPPNLMLLDEPTTHLDIPSTEALLAALHKYEGTILFISHDVYFIRQLANHVVHVRDGKLTPYSGNYDYYVERTGWRPEVAVTGGGVESAGVGGGKSGRAVERREQKRLEAEERKRLSRLRKELQSGVDALEKEIHGLEVRQAELTQAMEDPATYSDAERAVEVQREFAANRERLEELTGRWEDLAGQLEAVGSG